MSDEAVEIIVRTIDESTAATQKMDAGFAMLSAQLKQLNQSADVTNYQLGAMNEQVDKTGTQAEETGISMTELNAGLEVLTKALGYAQQAYAATIGVSMSYAESVRNLSQITGQSAQETSDLIQVADDFQLSADDLTASMRVLTKNGLVPNKETIISLATQYQAIQDPLAKNEFLIKNLGKASANYTNLLSENTDKLRANFDSQSQSLQFGDKQVAQAEQLRRSEDNLNDAFEHLKVTVGTQLTPALTNWITILNNASNWQENWRKNIERTPFAINPLISLMLDYSNANDANTSSLQENAKASTDKATADAQTTEQVKAAAEAAKALSDIYTSELSIMQSIQGATDSYNTSMDSLTAKQGEAKAALDEAITQGWAPTGQHVVDLQKKYDDLGNQVTATQEKYSAAMAKIAYDNLITKLSADGLTDAEFSMAQQAGVALGAFTQSSANQAVALNNLSTQLANGKITLDQFKQAVSDGSMAVDASTKNTANGYDMMTHNIATNSQTATQKISDIATAQDTFAQQTATKTQTASDAWKNMTAAVTGNINELITAVNSYIERLQAIPTEIDTTVKLTTPPANKQSGESIQSQVGGFADRMNSIRVDIFVDNVFNKSAVI